jgi:peptidoglycan/LPS O-acetylase OafA/YrhL
MDANSESPNLDFLRSAAVLFVVFFHVILLLEKNNYLDKDSLGGLHSIGNWGVLIFFVHTSLVLMFSLERQRAQFPGQTAYFPFLVRRIFRIYPLSVFVVACVAISKIPVGDFIAGRLVPVALHWPGLLANFLLIQNLTRTPSIIIPLWSLPYEMQMYLLLPALYVFVRMTRSILPIGILWILAFFAAIPAERLDRSGYPNLVEYCPLFLAGIVAYQLTKSRSLRLPAWLWPLTAVVITSLYLRHPSAKRGWVCTLLLGIAIPQFKEIAGPVLGRVFKLIARYSYGIYLVHFACIWLAFQVCARQPLWVRVLLLVATLVPASCVLYHTIEEPMIRVGAKLAAKLRMSGISVAPSGAV